MTISDGAAGLSAQIRKVVNSVPAGRIITFGALSAHFKTAPRHIATLLAALADDGRDAPPWHRVVADGGAVGRHGRREEQIRRLQAEGVAVSQGGFVQDFARAVILDIAAPMPRPAAAATAPLSRSRGIKDRPQ